MPTAQEHSLNYQPATEPYSYTPFKMSILKRAFITLAKLSPFIFAFLALFAVVITIVNYFNILSLSYFYPKIFGFLPHRYNAVANQGAISNAHYLTFARLYELDATLSKVKNNKITVELNGKGIDFQLSNNLHCDIIFTKKNNDNKDEIFLKPAECSDVLKNENAGKKVNIIFYPTSNGYSVINYINIE